MAREEVHVGDIGTEFRALVKDGGTVVDLTGVSTLEMFFEKPDGTVLTKTASLVNSPGTDGLVKYVTDSATVLDVAGTWKRQVRVKFSGSQDWKSEVKEFIVHPNIV